MKNKVIPWSFSPESLKRQGVWTLTPMIRKQSELLRLTWDNLAVLFRFGEGLGYLQG
jgi:hypothetical protein